MALQHTHDVKDHAPSARLRTIAERIGFRATVRSDHRWTQIRTAVIEIATPEKDNANVRRRSLMDDNPTSG